MTWDTGIHKDILKCVGVQSVAYPEDFVSWIFYVFNQSIFIKINFQKIHPHLEKTHVQNRLTKIEDETKIDWATAEAMAFGSLLYQGSLMVYGEINFKMMFF